MKRRFRKAKRAVARAFYRSHRRGRSGGGGITVLGALTGGAIYGAAAAPLQNFVVAKIRPYLGNMVGGYTDKIATIGVLWGIKKFIKNKMVRDACNVGFAIEGAKIGSQLTSGMLGSTPSNAQ